MLFSGDPYETRTRVTAVKGRCLDRLTKGPYFRHKPLFGIHTENMVAAVRFEPTTCRVWTGRYNQLSYAAICSLFYKRKRKNWLRRRDLNHTTFGLWARRATNCSTPRRFNARLFYMKFDFLSTVLTSFLTNFLNILFFAFFCTLLSFCCTLFLQFCYFAIKKID